jgi:glycosyltransferase involved in cell wall biosynthesis
MKDENISCKLKVLMLSSYSVNELASCFYIRYRTSEILTRNPNTYVTMIYPSINIFSFSVIQPKKNFKVISVPSFLPARFVRGGFSLFDLVYKTFKILTTKYDIIHVDMGHRPAGFVPAFIGKKVKKSKIINEWWEWFGKGGLADFRIKGLQKYIALYDNYTELPATKKYDGVIAITHTLKKRLCHTDIYNKTIVLYGGAETSDLKKYDTKEARSKLILDQESIIIGMINICEEDEEDNAIFWKAFNKLTCEYNRLMLLVTGNRDYVCNKFMPNINFRSRIIYPGWVDREDYAVYLSSCDFFVLPLRDNLRNAARWPNKISDYFSVEKPILTNPVGDLKQLFERHRLGLLCDTRVECFYDKTKLLIENKTQREHCCSDQWEFVHNELSFDGRVNKIYNFYINILSKS